MFTIKKELVLTAINSSNDNTKFSDEMGVIYQSIWVSIINNTSIKITFSEDELKNKTIYTGFSRIDNVSELKKIINTLTSENIDLTDSTFNGFIKEFKNVTYLSSNNTIQFS